MPIVSCFCDLRSAFVLCPVGPYKLHVDSYKNEATQVMLVKLLGNAKLIHAFFLDAMQPPIRSLLNDLEVVRAQLKKDVKDVLDAVVKVN